MNSGSGMMRIGVTVPLVSLIALFLILNMFFGAWILALPMAAALSFLIFFVGANRVKSSVEDLAAARATSVNLFGLPDLPRFYGFLHVFCWFIPPIIFVVLWQIFGSAWMDAQRTTLNMEVVSLVVTAYEGLNIDYEGMRRATNGLFSHYFLGTDIAPDLQQFEEGFTLAFDKKFIARRWFWLALLMAAVALWRLTPEQYHSPQSKTAALGGLLATTLALFLTGFVWIGSGLAVLLAMLVFFWIAAGRAGGGIIRALIVVSLIAILLSWAISIWRNWSVNNEAITSGIEAALISDERGKNPFPDWLAIAATVGFAVSGILSMKRGPIGALFGKLLLAGGGISGIVFLHHITQWGAGGWIFSLLVLTGSLVVLYRSGERFALNKAPSLILLVGSSVFVLVTIVSLAEMMTWVQNFVATEFGRPPKGLIDTNGGKVDRLIAELRKGVEITPEIMKDVRAKPAHLDAAKEWMLQSNLISRFIYFGVLGSVVLGALLSVVFIRPKTKARSVHEGSATILLITASAIAILVTVGLVLALLGSAELFFFQVPAQEFLNELVWNKGGINDGQGAERKSSLGALPVFYGTMMVSLVALLFAVPIGLFSAIYMSEYASATTRNIFKPILEILAGVPTIVYGVFALLIVGPVFRDIWETVGEPITGYSMAGRSALVAGSVMGIMLIPFISSLSDDALKSVPRPLRDGSLALGANKSETILKVLLPAALPGIMGGILLATSRAIGETMIVVLAAGRAAKLSANPLEPMTTVTVQIVEFLTGDLSLDTPEALSAFGLGLVLFLATLVLNMVAIVIVRRYRLKYS